jgi:hypothetical protein
MVHKFKVSGRGPFPFDMLRYDEAWPVETMDALKLAAFDRREITLLANREPTVARWESFGWLVTSKLY